MFREEFMGMMKLVLLTGSLMVMSVTASAVTSLSNIKSQLSSQLADDSKGAILCFDEKETFIFMALLDEKGITGEADYQDEINTAQYTVTKVTLPTAAQFSAGDVVALEIENATAVKYNLPVTIASFEGEEEGINLYLATAVLTTDYLTDTAASCVVGIKK
jgi:hypothetical protein